MGFFKKNIKKVNIFKNSISEMDIKNRKGEDLHIGNNKGFFSKLKDNVKNASSDLIDFTADMFTGGEEEFEEEFKIFLEKQKELEEQKKDLKKLQEEAPFEMSVNGISKAAISYSLKAIKITRMIAPFTHLFNGIKAGNKRFSLYRQFKKEYNNFHYANELTNNQINESREYAINFYEESVDASLAISDKISNLQDIEKPNEKELEEIKFLETEYKKTAKNLDNTEQYFDVHLNETDKKVKLSTEDKKKIAEIHKNKEEFKTKQKEIESKMQQKLKKFLTDNKKSIDMIKKYGTPLLAAGLISYAAWKILTLTDTGLNAAEHIGNIEFGNMSLHDIFAFAGETPAFDLDTLHNIQNSLVSWKSEAGLDVFNEETVNTFFEKNIEHMNPDTLLKLQQAITDAHATDAGYAKLVDILENTHDLDLLNSINIEHIAAETAKHAAEHKSEHIVSEVAKHASDAKGHTVTSEAAKHMAEAKHDTVVEETVKHAAEAKHDTVVEETAKHATEAKHDTVVEETAKHAKDTKQEEIAKHAAEAKQEEVAKHAAEAKQDAIINEVTNLSEKDMLLRKEGFNGMLDKFQENGQDTHNSLVDMLKTTHEGSLTRSGADSNAIEALHSSSEEELTNIFHEGIGSKLVIVDPEIGPQSVDSYLDTISKTYDVDKEKLYTYIMSRSTHGTNFNGNMINLGNINSPINELSQNFPINDGHYVQFANHNSNIAMVFTNDKLHAVHEAKKAALKVEDKGFFSFLS